MEERKNEGDDKKRDEGDCGEVVRGRGEGQSNEGRGDDKDKKIL